MSGFALWLVFQFVALPGLVFMFEERRPPLSAADKAAAARMAAEGLERYRAERVAAEQQAQRERRAGLVARAARPWYVKGERWVLVLMGVWECGALLAGATVVWPPLRVWLAAHGAH